MTKSIGRSMLLIALASTSLTGLAQAQTAAHAVPAQMAAAAPAPATTGVTADGAAQARTTAHGAPANARPDFLQGIAIPAEEFTLPNGLRVIVHTDRAAPIVNVGIWYRVGSRHEPAGRSGFAHLFEHLMFQGTENRRGEFFEALRAIGGSNYNGSTSFDVTNYFETVPTPALDAALWLESDRMGYLLGAVDQRTLDEQRSVVQNEKRQSYGAPYGSLYEHLVAALFPPGHPYDHTPIGSMADLRAATLDDVRAWFRSWYGPNNAVLTLTGDIDLATAREKVTRYFGNLAPSATVAPMSPMVPVLARNTRQIIPDRVPQDRVTRIWPGPPEGSDDLEGLILLTSILGNEGGTRLFDRLVRHGEVATSADASVSPLALSSVFAVGATLRDGVPVSRAESLLDAEIQRLIEEGPTQEEVDRVSIQMSAGFLARMDFSATRGMYLAMCAVRNEPLDCWRRRLEYGRNVTPASLRDVARRWFTRPHHTIVFQKSETPAPEDAERTAVARAPMVIPPADPRFTAVGAGVDRSAGMPRVTGFPEVDFPPIQRARLSNGMEVQLIERHAAPTVNLTVLLQGGRVHDIMAGAHPGRAEFAVAMMLKGAGPYNAQQFEARTQELGAYIGNRVMERHTTFTLTTLKPTLRESLDLLSLAMFRPTIDPQEMRTSIDLLLASTRQARARPSGSTTLLVNSATFGANHPAGVIETEATIRALNNREDVLTYLRDGLRPEGGKILVIGDVTLSELVPMLEARFGTWRPRGSAELPDVPQVSLPERPRIFLIDHPGSTQSVIKIAQLVPGQTNDMANEAFQVAINALAGGFTARLNMNLREDKGWSYGVYGAAGGDLDQRVWMVNAAVQADKTAESMTEMLGEITRMHSGQNPVTAAEVEREQGNLFTLPSQLATGLGVQLELANMARHNLPDDYVEQRSTRIRAVTPEAAQQAFSQTIRPNALSWVVAGPLAQIEAPIRALGWGEVIVIDAEGNPVTRR